MTVRARLEQEEKAHLSPYAMCSSQSSGRDHPITPDDLRTEFQRDRDRILHSKGFRRLKGKTQMILSPQGDHYRTRLSHTLEVAQIARTLARALRLNEDLTEAIALGHDLGHTPFGHMGERTLNRIQLDGFQHNQQSLRLVEYLEYDGAGLNLTAEVRDGILHHSGDAKPYTLEAWCVRRSDRIAYINHDIDDALRAGLLQPTDLPVEGRIFGETHGERINAMVSDIVYESMDQPFVRMSPSIEVASTILRSFLFERVYHAEWARREEEIADRLIESLYHRISQAPDLMPPEYRIRAEREGLSRSVCDYIASMTDRYAVRLFQQQFLPVDGSEL